ncbi:MAG: YdcF family protein [Anaerolineae bacterium]|nr:YdcF family protein [Anaerolineae bacterium]
MMRRIIKRHRKLILLAVLIGLLPVAAVVILRIVVLLDARDRIYALDDVPERRVAIVFGARVMPGGYPSHMLADRVKTGAALYHAGKVDALLMTGDNSRVEYNEPEVMRQYARSLGVPDDVIVLDYAGFRTYDSCYRARDIFQVESAILVTQAFHLPRALLTCGELGIDVVGVRADRPEGYRTSSIFYSQLRELPATTVAALDLLRRPQPTYLGEPLPILGE